MSFSMMTRITEKDDIGKVNYVEFLLQLNVIVKPGDLTGVSTQIQRGSDQTQEKHSQDQQDM